jgi:hypothetical protein
MSERKADDSNERAPTPLARAFGDLRRSNEYAHRVARMLEAKRRRRIEQVLRAQRQHRTRHAR